MELRHIKAFMMVSEEGSFSRAARRLGLAQPPLSAQIKQLEQEVGVPLFRRLPHGAALSPAGIAFHAVIRDLPGLTERALAAAQRVFRGEVGVLRLGFTASSIFNLSVTGAIAAFRQAYPDVELRLEEANTARLLQGLREGSLDAAFLRPSEGDGVGLFVIPLRMEPMVAVLRRGHPAAQGKAIDLADLAGEPILLFPREIGPLLFDIVVTACRQAGFEPRLGQTTPQIASIVHLVAAGLGCAIVPQSMSQLGPDDVVFRPFRDGGPTAPLAFARGEGEPCPLLLNLERMIREERGRREVG